MSKSLLMYYKNIPKKWAEYSKENFVVSNDRFENLVSKLNNIPKASIIFFQNGCKLFVPILFDIYKVKGIDFIDYFDSAFKQDKEYEIQFDDELYVIYNVGLEKALNTDFSSKLLIGLIEKLTNEEKIVFVCSHLSYIDFYKKYQIDIVNKVQLKEKQQEGFL